VYDWRVTKRAAPANVVVDDDDDDDDDNDDDDISC